VKTIEDFARITGGAVGPHGAYALPGACCFPAFRTPRITAARTALVEFGNDGNYIATHWFPTRNASGLEGAEVCRRLRI
jgi:selenium-binding protein 1